MMVLFLAPPQKRAPPRAVVGIETFGSVNPLPSQILLEVDVQRAKATARLSWSLFTESPVKRAPVSSSTCGLYSLARNEPYKDIWPWFFEIIPDIFILRSTKVDWREVRIFVHTSCACHRHS